MAVFTQYSDPSSGATTVDGVAWRTGVTDADWATLRAGAGNGTRVIGFGGEGLETAFYWVANADATWNTLSRFIATFDLSSIAGATVSAVTLSIFPNAKADPASVAPDVNVYGATPAANNNLANADYGETGATAYCDTPIAYADFNVDPDTRAYQDFVFNAAGIAAVQAAIDAVTKVFKLSLKNANKDVANSEPTKNTNETSMTIYSADKGTTYRPRLVITYTLNYTMPVTVGEFVLTGIANILTSARSIIASVGNFTLTGINAILTRGYTIATSVGEFILTGVSAGLLRPIRNMAVTVGEFALTGVSAVITSARTLLCSGGGLIKDLISYYKLDEASGDAIDSVGGNDGTVNGATPNQAGKIETAYSFDGNDYIDTPMVGFPEGDSPRSLSFWVYKTNTAVSVIYGYGNGVAGQCFGCYISNVRIFFWGYNYDRNTGADITLNKWEHIVMTYDGVNVRTYLNKELRDTCARTLNTVLNKSNFGRNGWTSGNYLTGSIDEMGIWNRVLTPTDEITALYNSGNGQRPVTFLSTGINTILSRGYTIATAVGNFTLTGIDALLTSARTMVVSAGSFTLTGIDAIFTFARIMVASVGTFTLTGINVILTKGWKMAVTVGSFVLTGIATLFTLERYAEKGLKRGKEVLQKTGKALKYKMGKETSPKTGKKNY